MLDVPPLVPDEEKDDEEVLELDDSLGVYLKIERGLV